MTSNGEDRDRVPGLLRRTERIGKEPSLGHPHRILSVFGTRPEAIKMAPVVRALAADGRFVSRVCVTAQHRDMLHQVLELFEMTPEHDLDLMRPRQTLDQLTARVLRDLTPVLTAERPDAVLVQGDTTTTFAAALAAFYAGIPVGHVEAGLRTGDLRAPFPEEANRLLTDRIATFFYPPTPRCRDVLLAEDHPAENVHLTGNTVIDALLWMRDRLRQTPVERHREALAGAYGVVRDPATPLILVTAHRRESFGEGFRGICAALRSLAERRPELQLVYPVHLNPHVQEPVRASLSSLPNVHLLEPLAYAPFVRLLDRATLVLTDSGGIQEEAPGLGKPVLVLRETTERPEGVEAGTVRLVGTGPQRIVAETERLLDDADAYQAMARAHNPYGDGHAAQRIVDALAGALAEVPRR